MTLAVRLLGPVQISRDDQPIVVRGYKSLALLAYLLVTGRAHTRQHLLDLLFDGPADPKASLRWTLSELRQAISPDYLLADRQQIAFNFDGDVWLDVTDFEAGHTDLYRGDFLEGLNVRDAFGFEEWALFERERFKRLYQAVLIRQLEISESSGDDPSAITVASKLLYLDNLRETWYRALMRAYARQGQREAALAQFDLCRQVLKRELGAKPAEETIALAEQIRAGGLEPASVIPARSQDIVPNPPAFWEGLEESAAGEMASDRVVFVARERELAQLDGFLNLALAGQGRVVFVVSDAGNGKTTLVQEFSRRAQAAQAELIVAGGNCNAFTGVGDPYLPFREVLGLLTGDVEARWASGAIGREQARRLWALIPAAVQALLADGPDLVDIFIPGPALVQRVAKITSAEADLLSRLKQLMARQEARLSSANLLQHDLFEQYTKVLQALARQRPILLVLDDLQWADAGSLNLLFHLGRRLKGQRLLIVGIYRQADVALGRDGQRHPLEPVVNELQRDFGQIQLDLNQADGRSFVKALLANLPNRLGAGFQETFYQHAQGHALCTVEMLRGMQERGDLVQDEQGQWVEVPTLDWETLPARVEGVIGERIGRLPLSLQEILKVASVEGEFFTAEVIARVQEIDESQVIRQLSGILDRQHRLVRSQSSRLLAVGGQRLSHYRFGHILFQRYLYKNLDEVERVYLHQAVGKVIEQLYEGQSAEVAVQLAQHFQMAGLMAKAVGYLQQAGEHAVRLSAYQEAIAHFKKALELLETLPDPSQYAQQELNLQFALAHALIVVTGVAAPEVKRAFVRALELCHQVEETPHLFKVLWGLWNFYTGESLQTAGELAEQCRHLAESLQDPVLLVGAHIALGLFSFFHGDKVASAQAHLEQGLALYEPGKHAAYIALYRSDPGVYCRRYLALIRWFQGYPQQALAQLRQALNLAHELSHPYSIAGVQAVACMLHYFRRDGQAVKEWAEENINLSTRHGFMDWRLHGLIFRGWALAEQGQEEEGIGQISQGLAAWYATGARSTGLLTGVHLKIEQGRLITLEKALIEVEKTGERFLEAELCRLKGELLLKDEDGRKRDEVEACFWQAIEVARRQNAKSLELRAVMSLSRLWQKQGRREEAQQMLAETYGWFTEGFDTADLQEARALLDELSSEIEVHG